jgi:phosphoribosylformylglycinamidine cyclo-ligase
MPPIFSLIQEGGHVSDTEMRRTFNLGVGMILVVSESDVEGVRKALERRGEKAPMIGSVVPGDRRVIYSGTLH